MFSKKWAKIIWNAFLGKKNNSNIQIPKPNTVWAELNEEEGARRRWLTDVWLKLDTKWNF